MHYTFWQWVQLLAPVVVIGAVLLSLPPYEDRK